jgi:sulfate/thiosulfate transport system substrate-binding protein
MGKRQICLAAIGGILASLTLLFAACGSTDEDATGEPTGGELHVVGYPGLDSAYEEALEPAFEKSVAGTGVNFGNSFGPSEEQSRAVAEGAPASIIHVEQAGEMEQLVEDGVVDANWNEQPYGGIAHETVIVFIVRKGNPKRIHSLRDILDRDVDVLTPNPFSSDAGRWNVMDVYATLIHERKTEAEALAGVKAVLEKAVAQPDSAADAFDAFLRGQGDVLLAYESEAIQAVEAGEGKRFQFFVPHQTMLVETPIAVTDDAPEPAAEDFLEFLWSEAGQILWAKEGYRPVEYTLVDQERFFPRTPFKIARFGGWVEVNEEFFDEETGSIAGIERELGVPIGG